MQSKALGAMWLTHWGNFFAPYHTGHICWSANAQWIGSFLFSNPAGCTLFPMVNTLDIRHGECFCFWQRSRKGKDGTNSYAVKGIRSVHLRICLNKEALAGHLLPLQFPIIQPSLSVWSDTLSWQPKYPQCICGGSMQHLTAVLIVFSKAVVQETPSIAWLLHPHRQVRSFKHICWPWIGCEYGNFGTIKQRIWIMQYKKI